MTTRFLDFVGSLSSSEEQLWFPNQNAKDPDTWTLSHLIQVKQEYKKLVEDLNCDIQEFITVQDPAAPPSNILHLPPLTSLHATTTRNMELLQPGEPRKVQLPSERTLSRQLMRTWPFWQKNITNVSNTRRIMNSSHTDDLRYHKMVFFYPLFHTPQTTHNIYVDCIIFSAFWTREWKNPFRALNIEMVILTVIGTNNPIQPRISNIYEPVLVSLLWHTSTQFGTRYVLVHRNLSIFVSFELHAWLILTWRLCRFNSSQNLCIVDYYSHRFVYIWS